MISSVPNGEYASRNVARRVSNGAHAIPLLVRRPLNVAQESILAFGFMARVSPKARNS
jgi:hypothetical protein